jgi:hypothetical protein
MRLPTYGSWWSHTNLLAIFVSATTHLTWLFHGHARRNVVSGLFRELPRLSGMSYLSPFDHLPPFWVSAQGWRHTYSIKHLIPDSMFITPWCKLDERFWGFIIKSAIQVNTLHYITLHYITLLLKTKRKVDTIEVNLGRYYAFNLLDGIKSLLTVWMNNLNLQK